MRCELVVLALTALTALPSQAALTQATATPAGATGTATPLGAPRMPAEAYGYRLVPSATRQDTSGTVRYQYVRHENDVITVFVAPYPPGEALRTTDDTTNFVLRDVSNHYSELYDAQKSGELSALAVRHFGQETLRAGPSSIRAAALWVDARSVGSSVPVSTYYATYALPTRVVRIAANSPAFVARFEETGVFSRFLVTGMVKTGPTTASVTSGG